KCVPFHSTTTHTFFSRWTTLSLIGITRFSRRRSDPQRFAEQTSPFRKSLNQRPLCSVRPACQPKTICRPALPVRQLIDERAVLVRENFPERKTGQQQMDCLAARTAADSSGKFSRTVERKKVHASWHSQGPGASLRARLLFQLPPPSDAQTARGLL